MATVGISPAAAGGGVTWVNQRSGTAPVCMDDLGYSSDDGAPIGIYGCNGGNNQGWVYPRQGPNGSWQLQNYWSKKCVTAGYSDGAPLYQYKCGASSTQWWHFDILGTDAWGRTLYQIRNEASHKCIDIRNFDTTWEHQLQVWGCSHNWNQEWA
jgi:hypothetical protein